ncbi:MAG: sulfatase-like hydrolase/transferase, partial [Nanoarchaeota archaeon]|nr:sulfatase-like hydrolase/transferase [Nanoarchaeota archaeon]
MKFLEHIKLAAFTGLVVGAAHGTIDIIIRISVLSFEWFELYQALLIPLVVYTLGFIVLSLFVELIRRVIKLKITNKSLTIFYFASAVILLIFFYVSTILNRILLSEIGFWNPVSLALNFIVFFVIGVTWILLITKTRGTIYSTINLIKKWKIKKFAKNYIFAAIIFIILSFFLDVYLLNYIPSFVPKAELKDYPNILLIEIDALRADHLSLYGYSFNTSPNIDRLAKDAVVFDTAISPAIISLPATASIFTGKYVSHHGASVVNQQLDIKETTLAEILKVKGYNTAGFVAGVFNKGKYGIGQGFNTYKDRMDFFEFAHTFERFGLRETLFTLIPNYESLMKQDITVISPEVNKGVLKWFKKNRYQPFFLYVHYVEPHGPWNLDNEYIKDFGNTIRDYPKIPPSLEKFEKPPKDIIDALFQLYDAEIKYTDNYVGKLLNKLDELNIKDNTIIIITSDHGVDVYEHGISIGKSIYQSRIHVPLIIYYPKELKPQRIRTPVSTIDIFPTILDMIDMEVPDDIDGVSLLPLMTGKDVYGKEFVASERYGRPGIEDALQQIAIIKGDWKLIEIRGSEILSPGLYNLRTDPN